MNKRIEPVDGLRALAVLGVLWVHAWSFFGLVPWHIGHIDVNRVVSVIGNGVDLFFVISGFCMFVMYEKKSKRFDGPLYKDFLVRRFIRIAPAFYLLIVIESLRVLFLRGVFPVKTGIYHLFFINIFLTNNDFAPHYWSLATEWQFYLILPLLFLSRGGKKNIVPGVFGLMAVCLLFRLSLFYRHRQDLISGVTIDNAAIWYRFIEFGIGIIAGKMYLANRKLPVFLQGWWGFVLSFMIAYLGRVCMVTEFMGKFGPLAFVVRAFSEPIMTLGFGLMMYGLISSDSIFRRVICIKPVLFLGKISYSFYLWHWLVTQFVCNWLLARMGGSVAVFYLACAVSVAITAGISWLSYTLLEAPYFRKSSRAPLSAAGALQVAAEESL